MRRVWQGNYITGAKDYDGIGVLQGIHFSSSSYQLSEQWLKVITKAAPSAQ